MKIEKIEIEDIKPLFVLEGYSDYAEGVERVEIYPYEIRDAEVGKVWSAENPSNIVRAEQNEYLELIYKSRDLELAVLRYTATGTYDSPTTEYWNRHKIFVVIFSSEDVEVEKVKR